MKSESREINSGLDGHEGIATHRSELPEHERWSCVEQVQETLRQLWPELIFSHMTEIDEGWDYRVWVLDQAYVVRIPRRPSLRWHLAYEVSVLRRLRRRLPIDVPDYVLSARGIAVYRWIPGTAMPDDHRSDGGAIGQFLSAWHQPVSDGLREERVRRRWRTRYERLYRETQDVVYPWITKKERRAFEGRFRTLDECLGEAWKPTRIHGDLSRQHLLVDQGKLTGIIDFGDMTSGDPALDFAGLGTLREAACASYGRPISLERVEFYAWAVPLYSIFRAVDQGHVEQVEEALSRLRRST